MTELLDEASKFILDEKTKNIVDTFLKHKPYIYIATMFSFLGSQCEKKLSFIQVISMHFYSWVTYIAKYFQD